MTIETNMLLYYRHLAMERGDTHSDSLLPIPKRNLASYPVIVRGGVSEMIAWNGTGWPHDECQSLRTPVLDPEAPSPLRASQVHELALGPENKQVGLVGKLLLNRTLKEKTLSIPVDAGGGRPWYYLIFKQSKGNNHHRLLILVCINSILYIGSLLYM